jgi:hypothetical protein
VEVWANVGKAVKRDSEGLVCIINLTLRERDYVTYVYQLRYSTCL